MGGSVEIHAPGFEEFPNAICGPCRGDLSLAISSACVIEILHFKLGAVDVDYCEVGLQLLVEL